MCTRPKAAGSPLVFLVAFLGAGEAWGRLYGDALEGTSLMEEEEEGLLLMVEALGGLSPMEVEVWEGPGMVVSSPR